MKIKKVLGIVGAAVGSVGAVVLSINVFNKMVYKNAVKSDEDYEKGFYYDWREGKVHYKVAGSGKPVLLVHSLSIGSSHREWSALFDSLSKRYKVYAIDLPGYGYSDKPKITYTAFLYSALIKEFIENEIGEKTNIIAANGSAMFAVIAGKLFPDCVSSIIAVSPGGINDKMAENSNFKKRTFMELPLEGTLQYNLKTSKKSIRKFFEEYGFYAKEKITDDLVNSFYISAHTESGNARYAFASFVTDYMNMDIKQYIKGLTMPLTIIWGEENTIFDTEAAQTVKDLVPWAKFYVFEKTKLFPHIENAEEFFKVCCINIK